MSVTHSDTLCRLNSGWWRYQLNMLLPNLVQVTESISGSVVPLAMFIGGLPWLPISCLLTPASKYLESCESLCVKLWEAPDCCLHPVYTPRPSSVFLVNQLRSVFTDSDQLSIHSQTAQVSSEHPLSVFTVNQLKLSICSQSAQLSIHSQSAQLSIRRLSDQLRARAPSLIVIWSSPSSQTPWSERTRRPFPGV